MLFTPRHSRLAAHGVGLYCQRPRQLKVKHIPKDLQIKEVHRGGLSKSQAMAQLSEEIEKGGRTSQIKTILTRN